MRDKIPFIRPNMPSALEIGDDLNRIHRNNYYSNNGPVYYEFKDAIEKFLGNGLHAVVISNATVGLMISLVAVFGKHRGKKKYIAIPAFTFAAGPLAIKWAGFEPYFFDVDEVSAQPDLESFNELLADAGDDLAGVVLINSFGIGFSDVEDWERCLNAANLDYIVDSAPGFGSSYEDGKPMGGRGKTEVFSFHATKPFGIGEGGLMTTSSEELALRYESFKNFGFDATKQTVELGFNAKITELDCAIGLRLLDRYNETLIDRRKTYGLYEELLSDGPVMFLPNALSAAIQFASIIVPKKHRDDILARLERNGIEARTYYAPSVDTFPAFINCKKTKLPGTTKLSQTIISLPVHPKMDTATVEYICSVIMGRTKRD